MEESHVPVCGALLAAVQPGLLLTTAFLRATPCRAGITKLWCGRTLSVAQISKATLVFMPATRAAMAPTEPFHFFMEEWAQLLSRPP